MGRRTIPSVLSWQAFFSRGVWENGLSHGKQSGTSYHCAPFSCKWTRAKNTIPEWTYRVLPLPIERDVFLAHVPSPFNCRLPTSFIWQQRICLTWCDEEEAGWKFSMCIANPPIFIWREASLWSRFNSFIFRRKRNKIVFLAFILSHLSLTSRVALTV